MKYTIIVDKQPSTNPTADKKEYIIDIEELRVKGDVYDSLVITPNEDYVIRRLSLSKFFVLSELDIPIKETIPGLNIELFEGDNYIYLANETGNKFYAEYLIKNEFNDIFVKVNEMNTAINQSAKQIELSVNQKLTNFSTTEEMNAIISAVANEINAEVSKKIDGETVTGGYFILKINEDISEAKLNADKIELSANNVLNLLSGNTINLSSKNITFASTNFNVDKDGNMTCNNANIKGKIQSGSTISGASIQGSSILAGSDNEFYVSSEGAVRCKNLGILNTTDNSSSFYIKSEASNKNIRFTSSSISMDNKNQSETKVSLSHNGTTGHIYCFGGIEARGSLGTVSADGSMFASNFVNTSEKSAKQNIIKLNSSSKSKKTKRSGLDIIKNSDICEFKYKEKNDTNIGLVIGDSFSAPEEIIKEYEIEGKTHKGIDQYGMVSIAWKAIQELQEIIENQNTEIQEIKEKLEKYEIQQNNPKN